MQDEVKIRVANMLLGELVADKDDWWYVSILTVKPHIQDESIAVAGGCFIKAKGPTDAWTKAHRLMLIPEHSTTSTMGPIEPDNVKKIPDDKKWRYLTKEEVESI